MFMVSFSFRFSASYLLTDTLKIMKYNVIASDLQALLAIFLWVKTLSLLDGNQYFGKTLRKHNSNKTLQTTCCVTSLPYLRETNICFSSLISL